MNTEYLPTFIQDLKKLKHDRIYTEIKVLVTEEIPKVKNILQLKNIKVIKGDKNAYRIIINHYIIVFFLIKNKIIFSRVLHDEEIYRFFPKIKL